MASKKGTREVRPTLAEVKSQTGRYLYITYEGVNMGGWSLPAPRPRFAGDVVEELMVLPFEPKQIIEEWLDDARFMKLYDTVPEIRVWKSDSIPETPDLTLPTDLSSSLNDVQKAYAKMVALSPYDERMREIIDAQDREGSEEVVIQQNRKVILPFLKAVQFYENRLMKRPEVLKALDKRIRLIVGEKSKMETAEPY